MGYSLTDSLAERLAKDLTANLMRAEGFDEALVGVAIRNDKLVAVYDREKCVEILARDMPWEDAEEYFDFNVAGAYLGPETPVFADI